MSDWKRNKNSGPWPFVPQPNKWGYLNDPRWTATPKAPVSYDGNERAEPQIWDPIQKKGMRDPTGHNPCGHWHKDVVIAESWDCNLYRVTDPWLTYGSIQSLFFDHKRKVLSLVDYYISNPGVCGLAAVDDKYLATVEGMYDSSKLVILDRNLQVVARKSIFLKYDCTSPRNYLVEYDADDKKIFIGNSGSGGGDLPNPGCITEVSYPGYERVGRFTPGYVIVGSDGNYYGYMYASLIYSVWDANKYPITGPYWDAVFTLIPDNIHQGTITPYIDGNKAGVVARTNESIAIYNNVIYHAVHGSPYCHLKSFYKDTYLQKYHRFMPTLNGRGWAASIIANEWGVYTAGGLWGSVDVYKFSHDLLTVPASVCHVKGSVIGSYSICALGNYIVVGTIGYVEPDAHLLVLNKDTLEIVYEYALNQIDEGGIGAQIVIAYGNFLFVGFNTHVGAFEWDGSSLVFLNKVLVDFPSVDVGSVSKMLKLLPA